MATNPSNFLLKRIIEPLLQWPDYGDYRLKIENTRQALRLGQLHSVREVEVMLVGNCDVSVL